MKTFLLMMFGAAVASLSTAALLYVGYTHEWFFLLSAEQASNIVSNFTTLQEALASCRSST